MKRFVTLTTATVLAATPLVAEQATEKVNQPTSPVYSESFPPDSFSSTGIVGSDVFTTNRGVANMDASNLQSEDLSRIGIVEDVVMSGNNDMAGILVDPVDTLDEDEMLWFFPRSEVIVVEDVDGNPGYMISYTEDEMSEIERVERDNWS